MEEADMCITEKQLADEYARGRTERKV